MTPACKRSVKLASIPCEQHQVLSRPILTLSSIDLSLPGNGSMDRNAPSWTTNLLDLYTETINVFSKYDNVLAYNVGNEVVIAPNGTAAAAFVKAAARDVKAYM
jgi:hypothetical protein